MLFGLLSLLMGHWVVMVAKICVKTSTVSSRFFPCAVYDNLKPEEGRFDSASGYANHSSDRQETYTLVHGHDNCPEVALPLPPLNIINAPHCFHAYLILQETWVFQAIFMDGSCFLEGDPSMHVPEVLLTCSKKNFTLPLTSIDMLYVLQGRESFASQESLEQLHRLMFVLGVIHVLYSFIAIALAMIKVVVYSS